MHCLSLFSLWTKFWFVSWLSNYPCVTAVSVQTNGPIAMEVTISRKLWALAFMCMRIMWRTHPNTNALHNGTWQRAQVARIPWEARTSPIHRCLTMDWALPLPWRHGHIWGCPVVSGSKVLAVDHLCPVGCQMGGHRSEKFCYIPQVETRSMPWGLARFPRAVLSIFLCHVREHCPVVIVVSTHCHRSVRHWSRLKHLFNKPWNLEQIFTALNDAAPNCQHSKQYLLNIIMLMPSLYAGWQRYSTMAVDCCVGCNKSRQLYLNPTISTLKG